MSRLVLMMITALLLLLTITINCASADPPASQIDKPSYGLEESLPADIKRLQDADQNGEPSTTSIHQVWASTSSGSLEELSPEMISKLRGDIPFLAAYATRPRLVNGAAISLRPVTAESFGVGSSKAAPLKLQVGASSQVPSRTQSDSSSVLSKLGDFNEFNVETSSSSKSEHTHRKSTSLKRKPSGSRGSRKRIMGAMSRLVDGRKRNLSNKRKSNKRTKQNLVLRNRSKSNRLKQRLNKSNLEYHMSIIRHGRYQDGQPTSSADNGSSSTNDSEEVSPQNQASKTNLDGTKGAGNSQGKKPFYQSARGQEERVMNRDELDIENKSGTSSPLPNLGSSSSDQDSEEEPEDEPEFADTPTPKRVGDEDVDEVEGDTVMVTPKSDGVDDDPELPEEAYPEEPNSVGDERIDQSRGEAGVDERGRRVGREKSNSGESSSAGGAGIGATAGAGDNTVPGVTFAGEKDDEDRSGGGESRPDDSEQPDDNRGEPREDSSKENSNNHRDDEESKSLGEDKTKFNGEKPDGTSGESPESSKPDTSSGDIDVDYRDDMESDRKDAQHGGFNKTTGVHKQPGQQDCHEDHDDHHHHNHHHNHHDTIKWLEEAIPGKPGVDYPTLSSIDTMSNFNCRDQKYPGYYADVKSRCQVFHICQADGRQDSFLCPNGTIFSQISTVCVWWNSFDCEDAPQYYGLNALLYKSKPGAVQTDGHTDEDSQSHPRRPQTSVADLRPGNRDEAESNEGSSSLDALVRSMQRNKDASGTSNSRFNDDPDSSLAPTPRRSGRPGSMALDGAGFLEDDTLVQKRTNSFASEADEDDYSAQANGSARLKNRGIPRRRRRASVRQAPPKLKSRRVLRNSRRRKLRHGPPKRRS